MKKISFFSGYVILVILLIICFWKNRVLSNQNKNAAVGYPKIYDSINSIAVHNLERYLDMEQDVVVYFGRPSCADCNLFEPEFLSILETYDIYDAIVYVNVHVIRSDEEQWSAFKEAYQVQYTPAFAHYKKGQLYRKLEWTPENGIKTDEVEQWLKDEIL